MASKDDPAMLLQAEKEFAQPVRLNLTRCCPTMDLVAVITNEEQLDVYRFNGQRAFGLQRKNASCTVSSICWKYNGKSGTASYTTLARMLITPRNVSCARLVGWISRSHFHRDWQCPSAVSPSHFVYTRC